MYKLEINKWFVSNVGIDFRKLVHESKYTPVVVQ